MKISAQDQVKRAEQMAARWRPFAKKMFSDLTAVRAGTLKADKISRDNFLKRAIQIARRKADAVGLVLNGNEMQDESLLESLVGSDNLLSTEFFESGLIAARSVGRIDAGHEWGTGFLVGENLLMTNNHVIESEEDAEDCVLQLNVEDNRVGPLKRVEEFRFAPKEFFYTSKLLDVTVCAVERNSIAGSPLSIFGYLPLISQLGKIRPGDQVNIIGHPAGGNKQAAIRDNQLVYLKNLTERSRGADCNNFCLYLADTLKGSSGSPVFNDKWEVIAVHHAGGNVNLKGLDIVVGKQKGAQNVNEGVRASRIVAAIKKAEFDDKAKVERRDQLLQLWQQNYFTSPMERAVKASAEVTTVLANGDSDVEITIKVSAGKVTSIKQI